MVYNDDPQSLIYQLLEVYQSEHYLRPSVFCRNTAEAEPEPVEGSQQDVVCGMWVPPEQAAARRTRDGHQYVFCSLQCAERFDDDPDAFLT